MKKHDLYLEKISSQLQELDETPLFGNAGPINLEDLSALLAAQLGIDDLNIRATTGQWKEKGKGTASPIYLSSIDEPIYWMMSKPEKEKVITNLFSSNKKKTAITQNLQEGFYRYLLLEVIASASILEPIQQMSLTLEEDTPIPNGEAFALDIEITSSDFTAWGKCIIPHSFRKKWVQHFAAFPAKYIPSKLARALPVEVGIQIGSIKLPLNQWKTIKLGDFLIPDLLSNNERGTLMLNNLPLFQVHIHDNKIELLSYAINIEEPMDESENLPLSQKLETVEKESKSIKEIPIHVSVELARLKIPLDQLMSLTPGNFLEIPSLSDKRVNLIANGQKIGVAELVRLGETLGLKILEI
jgi:flagellar motor switch protein FliN